MRKISLLASLLLVLIAGKSIAQNPCYSDEVTKRMMLMHPEIAKYEAEFNRQIAENIKKIDLKKAGMRTTLDESGVDSFWYDIPVVLHVIHDYGVKNITDGGHYINEYLTDDALFTDLVDWNVVYAGANADTSEVITPFKKWIGIPHIRIHLATIDPYGKPTKGITRHRSYLTYNAGDQAKFDDWDPTSYINIWFINKMSASNGNAAAYAIFPSAAASEPNADGIISIADYAANQYGSFCGKTINHEMGHVFSLYHPWGGNNNAAAGACSDGGTDLVDDTPPTIGHMYGGCTWPTGTGGGPAAIYDTQCARNYYKVYTSADGTADSLVNYPDTTNAQNIMDYTYCAKMFTKGQVVRMHAALNSDVAGRSNLWSASNLARTGALAHRPDLLPVPEFSATNNGYMQYFTAPGNYLRFYNKSWNDTVTKVKWNFTNGSLSLVDTIANPNVVSSNINQTFSQPGWYNVSMTATGNHTGDSTTTWNNCIYVADANATPGQNIVEDFDPAGDLAKWPTFNYYNNEFKWEPYTGAGFYDAHCMKYDGYDNRIISALGIYPTTGSPYGDFDDFFSIPVDLTSMRTGNCNLNFWTAGASRSSNSLDINDTLQVFYSTDRAATWHLCATYGRGDVANMGSIPTSFVPTSGSDWVAKTINLDTAARKPYVIFRFRYLPGTIMSNPPPYDGYNSIYSSGNNFYLDRITFSPYTAAVSSVTTKPMDIVVAPNPTSNNAYVIIKDAGNGTAKINVFDITGKLIYTTSEELMNNEAHIEIPSSAIGTKGVYMVQATTGKQTSTQKLVVY